MRESERVIARESESESESKRELEALPTWTMGDSD